jgi:hypothetical protein
MRMSHVRTGSHGTNARAISLSIPEEQEEPFYQNIFQKSFSSFKEATSSKKPEPKLYLEEPGSSSMGPTVARKNMDGERSRLWS